MSDDNLRIDIPDVNSDSGLKLCRGNRKIYIQSLRLFVSNMPVTLTKMSGVTENSLKDYITNVHSLKGMCVYIGAEEARKTAKELEDMAEAGDIKGVLQRNDIFIGQTKKIISNIQTWLDNNSNYLETLFGAGRNHG